MRLIYCAPLMLAAAGCGWIRPEQSPDPGPPAINVQDDTPASPMKLEHCAPADKAGDLRCGQLKVPENRAQPGREITLNVVVVPSSGSHSLPPLYSFEGGPGIAASQSAGFWLSAGAMHREHRDIVLIDQRGTGKSAPLPCPVSFSDPLKPVLDLATVKDCRARLSKQADLSQYTTAAAVQDIEDVRKALGHRRIDVIGLSYGTRVAQEYVRAYPGRVRAMVLLGTLSPEEKLPLSFSQGAQDVLDRLVRECRMEAACRKAYPNLSADIAALRGRGSIPATLEGGRKVTMQAGPFWEYVRALMVSASGQRRVPSVLHAAAHGRLELPKKAPANPGENGLLLSVACPEDTLRTKPAEVAASGSKDFGTYRVRQQIAACKAWGVKALDRPRPGFVESDIAVLLMVGEMDGVTPEREAREVAAHMPAARIVVVPHLGHFPDGLSNMDCYDGIIRDFFRDGSAAGLNVACLNSMEPPPFYVSEPAAPGHKTKSKGSAKKKRAKASAKPRS